MRAWKYGSLYARRAASTARRLVASRLKNQTPGFPSCARTQVRTFSSRKDETRGSGRRPRARRCVSLNGTTPSQALPSCSSISSCPGTYARSSCAGTRQCAKSRSSHVCPIVQPRGAIGQGRCSVCSSDRACRAAASRAGTLQVAAERLFALDRLEEGFEVAVPETARAVALDHLEEDRRTILGGLREDLQEVAVLVAV